MSDPTPTGAESPRRARSKPRRGAKTASRAAGAEPRAIGKLPDSLKTAAAVVAAISSLIGSIVVIGQNAPQLPHAIDSILAPFAPSPKPGPLVVFVSSDDVLTNSYVTVLQDEGIWVHPLDPSRVRDLLDLRPGLVVFGASSPQADPPDLSQEVRDFLASRVKVIGIGLLGTRLFEKIQPNSALSSRHATGMTSRVVSLARKLPNSVLGTLPGGFPLYDESGDDPSVAEAAIVNQGGLELQGAKAIAELQGAGDACNASPWPVAQQGNRVLWGSGQPAWRLSSEARQLFVNIVRDLRSTDILKPSPQAQFLPGPYPGRTLGCRNTQNEYPLQVSGPGKIEVTVHSKSKLVLTLAASRPGDDQTVHSDYLSGPVTAEQLSQGESWLVLVTYDGSLSEHSGNVEYDLDLDYPSQTVSEFRVRAIVGGMVAGALLALLSVWLIWTRRADLRARLERMRAPRSATGGAV